MKTGNIIQEKSYLFALKIIKVFKNLKYSEKEHILSSQLLRSGTSIGANVEEAIGGQSKRDFLSKISISYKEAREVKYWLRLLKDSSYLNKRTANQLIDDCDELLKLLSSIIKSTKRNSGIINS